jgi:hypothetical protein
VRKRGIRFSKDDLRKMLQWEGLPLPADAPAAPPPPSPPPPSPPPTPSSTVSSAAASPLKVLRDEWLNRYLTKEHQVDLASRHDNITDAANEIHDVMLKDPTVEAYTRARNIERHPIVRKLFPPSRPPKKK